MTQINRCIDRVWPVTAEAGITCSAFRRLEVNAPIDLCSEGGIWIHFAGAWRPATPTGSYNPRTFRCPAHSHAPLVLPVRIWLTKRAGKHADAWQSTIMVVVWRVSVPYPCRLARPTLTEQPLARSQLEASERGTTCGAFKAVLVLTYRASALQIGLEQAHPEADCPSRNVAKKGNS